LLFSTGQAHENVNGGFPSEIFCGLTESLARELRLASWKKTIKETRICGTF
jgi:hypothetical protein